MLRLDHLVFAANRLGPGTDWLSDALGTGPVGGGQHGLMGTHNALWRLGDAYLEMIAIDPDAQSPGRPRWYGLDTSDVAERLASGPQLLTWAARTGTIAADVAAAPRHPGAPLRVTRDALYWDLTVPDDGRLIWEGAYPTLIQWPADVTPPSETLPDAGLALTSLSASGPAAYLSDLKGIGSASIFGTLEDGPRPSITAGIRRVDGRDITFRS